MKSSGSGFVAEAVVEEVVGFFVVVGRVVVVVVVVLESGLGHPENVARTIATRRTTVNILKLVFIILVDFSR